MAEYTQALAAHVFDATPVRLTELGEAWLRLEGEGLDTAATEDSLFDLLAGTEKAFTVLTEQDRDTILGYLIETYGLLAVGTDPLLRPLLPPVPAVGGTVRVFVLGTGVPGQALTTGVPGEVIAVSAAIVPAESVLIP